MHPDNDYQEVVYFHPFARDFLYADGYHTPDKRPIRRLSRSDVTRAKVAIKDYPLLDLKIERAEIYLCKPNVMVFCLEVSNKDAKNQYETLPLDVVHDFRDQFRRVFPPFFKAGTKPGETEAGLSPKSVEWEGLSVPPDSCCRLDSPKKEFDAFTRQGAEPPVFAHWRVWFGDKIQPLPRLIVPGKLRGFGRFFKFCKRLRRWIDQSKPKGLFYEQIMDERMQCMSYLAAAEPSQISTGDCDRLTFVDASGTDEFPYNPAFLKARRDAHKYDRFDSLEYRTAYYFCAYAFTALGRNDCPNGFYTNHVLQHFRHQYYRMAIVAHYQRAALLYFSNEMAIAAKRLAGRKTRDEPGHRGYRDSLNDLQMQFIKFRSRSYFPDLTNQLQGQELNRLWFKHLDIQALFDQVDRTCDQINEVFTQRAAERLNRWVAVFVPLSIGLTLVPILFDDRSFNTWPTLAAWIGSSVVVGLSLLLGWLLWRKG